MNFKNTLGALLILIVLLGGKCTEKETMNGNSSKCIHIGVVKDLTGLDGCGLVIESDGETYEPVELPKGQKLNAGDSIRFSYTVFNGASICMVGKQIKVTCLEITKVANPPCNPIKIIQMDSTLNVEKSAYKFNSYRIENNKLTINISFSGCSNNYDQELFVSRLEMKSLPPQRICVLSFKPQLCEAYITTDVCFDLSQITYETVLLLKTDSGVEKIVFTP